MSVCKTYLDSTHTYSCWYNFNIILYFKFSALHRSRSTYTDVVNREVALQESWKALLINLIFITAIHNWTHTVWRRTYTSTIITLVLQHKIVIRNFLKFRKNIILNLLIRLYTGEHITHIKKKKNVHISRCECVVCGHVDNPWHQRIPYFRVRSLRNVLIRFCFVKSFV